MGTDWYRMRLRPSAGDADLPALIRQQAAAFRASGRLWDGFKHLTDGAGHQPGQPDCPAFSTYVQVDEGAASTWRVAGFVLNPIFGISRIPDFGDCLANALSDRWHVDCLAWLRRSAEQGYGLLLDE